ncbi:MAG TPA: enoyl-CoA hydratase-related protein [Burkholderiaceae bacterium]|nr:enoyl-CoA hydratase-related protein [Burkholderiaceae bacterium]
MAASLSTDRIDQLLVLSVTRTHSGPLPEALCAAGLEVIETLQSQADIGAALLVLSPPAQTTSPADEPLAQTALLALDSWVEALAQSARPIVAVLEGDADAAVLPLALACGLRVACVGSQWAAPLPGGGITRLLPQALPAAVGQEWLLRRNALPAARLYEVGAINLLAPAGQVLQSAIEWAAPLAQQSAINEALLGLWAAAPGASLGDQQAAERRMLQREQIAALRSGGKGQP